MKEKFTTKIIVTETRVTNTGKTRTGGDYTLYQIIATKPSGEAIDMNLRAFEDLPKNEVIEVDAQLFRSEQYGDSYTLQRKGTKKSGSLGPKVDELDARVKRIEDFLSGRGEFAGSAAPQPQAATPPPPPPPPPPPEPAPAPVAPPPPPTPQVQPDPVGDNDIPF